MKQSVLIITLIILVVAAFVYFNSTNNQTKKTTGETINLSPTAFKQQMKQRPGVIIDVRTQDEFDQGHLAEVDLHSNLLNGEFEASLDSLDKGKTYYLYCRSGNRSGKAAKLMKQNGFEHVYNIGGFRDLVNAGIESSK